MLMDKNKERLFLDARVLVAGAISPPDGSGYILLLGEMRSVEILVCQQVLAETRRAMEKKAPRALPEFERITQAVKLQVCPEPTIVEISHCREIIHPDDAPILAAAMDAKPDSLITLNTHHFIDDPQVAQKSGLRIETPRMYLARLRQRLEETG
jgi:predicted nucleic acid-binding protein